MKTATITPETIVLWEQTGTRRDSEFDANNDGHTNRAFSERKGWTRDDIAKVVTRVNRGAQLLDEEQPGWAEAVTPQRLRMENAEFCIIGQVYGDYDECVGVPFGYDFDWAEAGATRAEVSTKAIEHGFMTLARVGDDLESQIPFALLDRVWVYMLTERRNLNDSVELAVPDDAAIARAYERAVKIPALA